jgi:hypothetical protein
MQLLPQALALLRVDEHTTEALQQQGQGQQPAAAAVGGRRSGGSGGSTALPPAATGGGEGPAAAPAAARALTPLDASGGMDWATVLVYVCPRSCDASHEEVAVVVPSDD